MKRTIKEWLEHIADPIVRERALDEMAGNVGKEVDTFQEALDRAFVWAYTCEGHKYWCNVSDNIELLPFND